MLVESWCRDQRGGRRSVRAAHYTRNSNAKTSAMADFAAEVANGPRLGAHFLALEHHVARHEQQDGRGDQADDLRPYDEHALQQRQRRGLNANVNQAYLTGGLRSNNRSGNLARAPDLRIQMVR